MGGWIGLELALSFTVALQKPIVWHYRDYLHVLYYIILWKLLRECFNPQIKSHDKWQDDQQLPQHLQPRLTVSAVRFIRNTAPNGKKKASDELFNSFSPSELRHNGTVRLPGGITLNGIVISIRMLQRAVSTPSARDAKWNLRAALVFTGRRAPLSLFLRLTFSCRSTAYSLVKKASHYNKRMFLL